MRRISLACCVLLLGACAHAPIPQSGTHLRAEAPAPSGTVPAPIQISTILPKPTPTSRPETYSVVVNGVKAQELLFALARDARLNIDVHPGITGTVTINAIEQTLPQLLTRISKQVDMRWELDGPNLIVMPDSPYLHTYRIDYVNMERNAIGTVGVSSQIGTGGGTAGAGGGAAGAGGGNSSSTTVRNTSDNKFWVTLEKNIKDILHETDKVLPTGGPSPQPRAAPPGAPGTAAAPEATAPNISFREAAAVIVNAEASLVIVRATSRQHEKIQEFLDQVMANVRRQVLIEATIAGTLRSTPAFRPASLERLQGTFRAPPASGSRIFSRLPYREERTSPVSSNYLSPSATCESSRARSSRSSTIRPRSCGSLTTSCTSTFR